MSTTKIVSKRKKTPPLKKGQEVDKWLEIFSLFIHDIESPLASMKYLLKLLNENRLDLDKPIHQRILKSTEISLVRAESIIYDIMAVAKSGNATFPVNFINLAPETIIKEAIDLVSGSAEEKNIKVIFKNNSGNTAIKADPKLLKRVLDNLLFNAVRHTPDGSEICVYTELSTENVTIHIKDSGSGLGDIDPTILFEKYGQVELRAERKHRGVGLGLYFCKLAVSGMGGTILADDHPNGGAVFSIMLNKATEIK